MKKLITLIVLGVLSLTSCYKVYYPPLENYYVINNKSRIFRFNESSFGLQLWRGYSWVKCEKIGDNTGYIIFDNTKYRYSSNKDTVRLYEDYLSTSPDTLKYILILDKDQVNVPGIFQKK